LNSKIYLIHMVKNICQVSQPMDKILSFKVFQEWVFFFFQKKMKILPLLRINTSGLVLLKASELLCGREALHILLPFLDRIF